MTSFDKHEMGWGWSASLSALVKMILDAMLVGMIYRWSKIEEIDQMLYGGSTVQGFYWF
jgi:hypothetical protein